MSAKEDKATVGISTLLFIIFLTLKLAEVKPVADWSWLWIFSPLWIPAAITVTLVLILIIIASITD